MKCVKCNKEIKDNAKFCNHCGAAQPEKKTLAGNTCPNCGAPVSDTAKFCKACGTKLAAAEAAPAVEMHKPNVEMHKPNTEAEKYNVILTNQHVTWKIAPGQLAVKIDEQEMASYKRIKGVYVAPGTAALFYVNGRCVATLESGRYDFDDYSAPEEPAKESPAVPFLKKIARHIANGFASLFGGERSSVDAMGNKAFYSVVLVKGATFPLFYEFDNVISKNVSSKVAIHMLCKVSNYNEFFAAQLTDKKFIGIETFSNSLDGVVLTVLNQALANASPEEISYNQESYDAVLSALQNKLSAIYPYIAVTQIITLTAKNEEIEALREKKSELYVSELNLTHLQALNTLNNRLRNEENRAKLDEARSEADYMALITKIDEEKALTNDERAKFALMLASQRQLREARTETETNIALNGLLRSEMLSNEEIISLEAQIKQRLNVQALDNNHVLSLKALQSKKQLEDEATNWDIAIGKKKLDSEIEATKKLDDYNREKARADAEYADERREADFEFKKREQDRKIELLKQANEIRQQREDAQHKRQMEEKQLDNQHELDVKRITASMSAEQILATSESGAAALAEKYKAEAAAASNTQAIEMAKQHNEQIASLMEKQNANLMQIAMASINANTVINQQQLDNKEKEVQRIYNDSVRNQEHVMNAVATTVKTVGTPSVVPVATPAPVTTAAPTVFCTNCGKSSNAKSMVCPHCGNTLE